MPHVETASYELFYTVKHERTGGPNLVLIHGAGGSRLHWPPELRRMGGATVYTLDLPGHGRSAGSGCETIACYADAVVEFLTEIGLGRAVLVGHSMGGAICQEIALRRVDRVAALVLVGTGARLRVAPAILEGIQDDFEQAVELITHYAWSPKSDPSLRKLGREALEDTGPEVLLGDFQACDQFDAMAGLTEIAVPVLVVSGTADKLTPTKYARFLAERIPDAQLVTIEGAGHMVMLERPEAVAEALGDFVTLR